MKRIKEGYILIPLIVAAVPLVSASSTMANTDWYQSLVQPAFAPPSFLFGIVWTILYILIAILMLLVWLRVKKKDRRVIAGLFCVNLFANAIWSPVFFIEHQLGLAVFIAAVIALTAWLLIHRLWLHERTAAWLLVPYALWTTFATVLAASLWFLNL